MFVHLRQLDNTAVCADLMRAGVLQCGALDLECASLVLSALLPLLESPEEDYQLIALEATSTLLQQFGALIHTHRAIVADAVGVDLSAEARQQRCQACFERFEAVWSSSAHLLSSAARVRSAAANLRAQLHSILQIE